MWYELRRIQKSGERGYLGDGLARDRMEVASEPVRAIGPPLANKKGTEIGWVTSGLRH